MAHGGKREGAGRPSVGSTKRLSLTLPDDIWKALEETKGDTSMSAHIRKIIVNLEQSEPLGGSSVAEDKKVYKFVEPEVTQQELVKTLVRGLERSLTQQEANTLHWLSGCDYETRGVLVDMVKELVEKIEYWKEEE